jgi:hypothetical protein
MDDVIYRRRELVEGIAFLQDIRRDHKQGGRPA